MNGIDWTGVIVGRLSKEMEIIHLEIEVLAEALGIIDLAKEVTRKKVMKEEMALAKKRDLEIEAEKKASELGISTYDYLIGEAATGNMAAMAATANLDLEKDKENV